MTWVKISDTFNSAPEIMSIVELAADREDSQLVLALKGAIVSLYAWSGQNNTDYFVSRGAALSELGPECAKSVLADLVTVGILTEDEERGGYMLSERDDFIHLIKTTDKQKRAKHRADLNRPSLMVPVLLRDGDRCRYCGESVTWKDTKSDRGGTIDHRDGWEAEATANNVVVACRGCNSTRQNSSKADTILPLLSPPDNPSYGEFTLGRLKKWARVTASVAKSMGITNPLDSAAATGRVEPRRANVSADSLQPVRNPFNNFQVSETDSQVKHDAAASTPSPEVKESAVNDGTSTPTKRRRRNRRTTRGKGRKIKSTIQP